MRWKYLIFGLPGLLIAIPAIYILASIPGALIPGSVITDPLAGTLPKNRQIYILSSLLHADIAIPVDDSVLKRFSFLKQANIELDHPGLQYLVFGWGSREFYTTAGSYSDITFSATYKAVTGDRSVMHVVPTGQLKSGENTLAIQISESGFERLLEFMQKSFATGNDDRPIWLEGKSHGYGGEFFAGVGDFNIFKPCNTWTGQALKIAGIQAGAWTPTTYGLKWALSIHQ